MHTRGFLSTFSLGLPRFSSTSTTSSLTPHQLLASYPIRLRPSEAVDRPGYFERYPPGTSLLERGLLMPFRLQLAQMAGKGFLNNRINADTADGRARDFFPRQFQKGVSQALPTLFNRLSNWNGIDDNKSLSPLVTPDLLSAFSKSHKALKASGHSLSFRYKANIANLDSTDTFPIFPTNIWLTFGSPQNATSTLFRGPVIDRNHLIIFTRRVNTPKTPDGPPSDRRVFREICFEYVYEPHELRSEFDDGKEVVVPDFEWKRSWMDKGAKVGVDSVVSGSTLHYKLTRDIDGVLVEEGHVDLAGMGIRMESSHFIDEFPDNGVWRIADVDNYLIAPRVLEEERPPILSV
ncbi:hypothetical protein HDU79_001686 [Rhizoclosmatium sp. JEL0117]|nr:hypothetical protein HDU79_001686 [Rhizoclosmatium sp. JEL0117]